MKRAVAVLALILLIVSSVALAVDLDLDSKRDFRGVACGAGVPSDMKKQNDLFASEYHWWESSHWKSGTVAYKRNKDDLAIANVQLSSVTYYFFEGRFLGASVEVKKGDLFSSLSTAIGTKAIEQETRLGDCEHTWKGQSLIVVGTGQCTSVLGSRDALAIEAMTGERLAEQLARSGDFICAEELTGKEQDRHKIIVGEEAKKLNAARPKKRRFVTQCRRRHGRSGQMKSDVSSIIELEEYRSARESLVCAGGQAWRVPGRTSGRCGRPRSRLLVGTRAAEPRR